VGEEASEDLESGRTVVLVACDKFVKEYAGVATSNSNIFICNIGVCVANFFFALVGQLKKYHMDADATPNSPPATMRASMALIVSDDPEIEIVEPTSSQTFSESFASLKLLASPPAPPIGDSRAHAPTPSDYSHLTTTLTTLFTLHLPLPPPYVPSIFLNYFSPSPHPTLANAYVQSPSPSYLLDLTGQITAYHLLCIVPHTGPPPGLSLLARRLALLPSTAEPVMRLASLLPFGTGTGEKTSMQKER